MQTNTDHIIRDCCEAEVAEFGKPDTICITVDDLREIVQRHSPGQCLHQIQEPVVLPDGSAFAVASFPLPEDHWLYAPREYDHGAEEPKELPRPILTHAQRDSVVAAVRYAVRGATMCGKESDFDPDALVLNAVYALCGPFNKVAPAPQAAPAAVAVPDERAAFEKWASFVGYSTKRWQADANLYEDNATEDAWIAWQARAALAATQAAAAPVVLTEPAAVISEVMGLVEKASVQRSSMAVLIYTEQPKELSDKAAVQERDTVKLIETKLRALLAGVSAPAAQTVEPLDIVQAAADAASVGHLSHLIDHQSQILARAMAAMKAVESTASPADEADGDFDARIPYESWATFVDARAELLYSVKHGPIAYAEPQQADAREAQLLAFAVSEIRRDEFAAPQAQADAQDAEITWPKARDVGRIGDMSPCAHMRVGFDSDNDVLVSVWDERGGGSIEFCNPGGGGGGQSSRTRMALIALMVAMEADNAEKPSRDWWAQRAAQAAQQGGDKQ